MEGKISRSALRNLYHSKFGSISLPIFGQSFIEPSVALLDLNLAALALGTVEGNVRLLACSKMSCGQY